MGLDFAAPFGGDLTLGPSADIQVAGVTGDDFSFLVEKSEQIQRIVRRLLTNPGEWIPFPTYGGGLRQYVGQPLSQATVAQIRQVILTQVLQEPDIAPTPAPTVQVQSIPNGIQVYLLYYSTPTTPVSFAFNITNPGALLVAPAGSGGT